MTKRTKLDKTTVEEIGKIANPWQLVAFVMAERPKMFVALIIGIVVIVFTVSIRFSIHTKDFTIQKVEMKKPNSVSGIKIPSGVNFSYTTNK